MKYTVFQKPKHYGKMSIQINYDTIMVAPQLKTPSVPGFIYERLCCFHDLKRYASLKKLNYRLRVFRPKREGGNSFFIFQIGIKKIKIRGNVYFFLIIFFFKKRTKPTKVLLRTKHL